MTTVLHVLGAWLFLSIVAGVWWSCVSAANHREDTLAALDAAADSPAAPAGVGMADAGAAAKPHGGAGKTDQLPGNPPARSHT